MNQTGAADVEESLEYAGTTTEQPIVSFFARAIFRERSPTIINTIPLGVVLLFEKWLCFVTEDRDEPGATHLAKELGRAVLPVIGKEVLRGLTGITGNAVDLTTKIFRKLNPNDPDDVDIREELNSTNSFVIPTRKIVRIDPNVSLNGGYFLLTVEDRRLILHQDFNVDSKLGVTGFISMWQSLFKAYKGFRKGQWHPEFFTEMEGLIVSRDATYTSANKSLLVPR